MFVMLPVLVRLAFLFVDFANVKVKVICEKRDLQMRRQRSPNQIKFEFGAWYSSWNLSVVNFPEYK